MARKRMIDPSIWQSEDFSKLSTLAKLVFIGLFSNADDEGRGRAKAIYIKSIVFPYDEALRVTDIEKSLDEIAANMSITFYLHDGSEYYSLENWSKWQKIDKAQASQIPAFDEDSTMIRGTFAEQSSNSRRTIVEQSSNVREPVPPKRIEENRSEEKGKEEADDFADRSFSPDLKSKIQEWLTYKSERKEGYKPTGKKSLLTMLENKAKQYGEAAVIATIDQSMASGWKGLFWDKLEKAKGNTKTSHSDASYNIGEMEDFFLHNTPVYGGKDHE